MRMRPCVYMCSARVGSPLPLTRTCADCKDEFQILRIKKTFWFFKEAEKKGVGVKFLQFNLKSFHFNFKCQLLRFLLILFTQLKIQVRIDPYLNLNIV